MFLRAKTQQLCSLAPASVTAMKGDDYTAFSFASAQVGDNIGSENLRLFREVRFLAIFSDGLTKHTLYTVLLCSGTMQPKTVR